MPMVAIACYVLAFNSNRPNYDIIEQYKPATPILVAKSYNDELKFKENILTKEQLDNIIADVQKREKEEKLKQYQKDLYLLSQVRYSEVGSNNIPYWVQLMVGSVVMNRVDSNKFPNTIYNVVHQYNQYQFVKFNVKVTPNARALFNAEKVLKGYRNCSKNTVWQSESRQGNGTYKTFRINGKTLYFCYSN